MEKKRRILKQQIKLLTGKTTLARQTKVLSQALIHLNDADCPIIQTEALYQDTQYHEGTEVMEYDLDCTHCGLQENTVFSTKREDMRNREMIHIHFKHTLFRYIYLYTQLANNVSKNGSLLPVLCSLPFLIKTVWQGNFTGFYPAYVQRTKGVGKTVLHSRACKYYS